MKFTTNKKGKLNLDFENGNSVYTVFSSGTYSDNFGISRINEPQRLESKTVEVWFLCGKELSKKIHSEHPKQEEGRGVLGYISGEKWLEIVNLIANEKG